MNRREFRELWTKPVPETKYLNVDNVERYRLIMRFFYDNHKKLKYWLKPEEVYQGVVQWGAFDYSEELCQRDLEQLTEWQNLTSRHDGGRVATIQDYLRKRHRYQLTPYSIEIERMLEALEQIHGYGGSLEATLLERMANYVWNIRDRMASTMGANGHTVTMSATATSNQPVKPTAVEPFQPGEAGQLWRDLQNAFRQLHENASDYLASLQTVRAEELMLTDQFLVYKETLTQYLKNFMVGLQIHGSRLEGIFRQTELALWHAFLQLVVADELRTPSLEDVGVTPDSRFARRLEEWQVFVQWFIGTERDQSDVVYLERQTKDTIARMVRYALAIQEKQRWGVSRKRELEYLGEWFLRLESLEDAHRLAAYTYGLFPTRHFQGDFEWLSDSADVSMWEDAPCTVELGSRKRGRRKAGETQTVRDRKQQQEQAREVILAQMQAEAEMLRTFVDLAEFQLSALPNAAPVLLAPQRRILLSWISRCLGNRSRTIHTLEGLEVQLQSPVDNRRTRLIFTDGTLELPDFSFRVREVKPR